MSELSSELSSKLYEQSSELSLSWTQRQLQTSPKRKEDHRSPFQRDRARILHSAAFRRLQGKTQVHGVGANDFFRTRLTHSLEVAQIGAGLEAQLQNKNPTLDLFSASLIEALCLAHDIGHPPFGHGGEVALNYMMRDHGGFEGNGQTFRILTKIEPYTKDFGMDLTRRTLLGIIKYPNLYSTLKGSLIYETVDNIRCLRPSDCPTIKGIYDDDKTQLEWVLELLDEDDKKEFSKFKPVNSYHKTIYKSFDCSIMELADDIAYAIHDLEDAIVMGLVTRDIWESNVDPKFKDLGDKWINDNLANLANKLFSVHSYERKDAVGMLINGLITSVRVKNNQLFQSPLLANTAELTPEFQEVLDTLKKFEYEHVIKRPEIQIVEYRGQQIVMELFQAFASDPKRLLPLNLQTLYDNYKQTADTEYRIIADYISGMTDDYAAKMHQHLFYSETNITL